MFKADKGYLILLMFFSPILGLINLLKSKDDRVLIFFGVLFFGIFGSLYVYRPGSDGETHLANAILYYSDMSVEVFFKEFYELATLNSANSGAKDLYLHCISYLAASVFGIPELIHVFAGLVLGYFFSKSVLLILQNKLSVKKNRILIGFIIVLLLYKSLGAMNSIRMWTGMWIFFYGALSYATTKKKKYLLILLLSIVVHFSYLVVLIPFFGAYIFRRRTHILTIFYLLSFGLTLNFANIENYIPKTSLIESQQDAYVVDSEEDVARMESRNEIQSKINRNFYVTYGEGFFISILIPGLTLVLLFFFNSKYADDRFNFLMASGIGLFSFSNVVTFSPTISGRVKIIAGLFIIAATIHLLFTLKKYQLSKKNITLLNRILVIFLIASIPMVLFQMSYLIQILSFFTLVLPPVSWLLGNADFSIKEGIGLLF